MNVAASAYNAPAEVLSVAAYRQIIDLGNLANSRSIHIPGQSGHPASKHYDDFIPLWERVGAAVHRFDCKYILQLSHSGRQMDLPGVHNQHRRVLSATGRKEPLHGFLCRAASKAASFTRLAMSAPAMPGVPRAR